MMKKRKRFTNRWRKFLVIGLAILITGSSSLQGAVALEKDPNNKDKKVKNEIEKREDIQKYIPGQVIVKFKEGVSFDDEFLNKNNLKSAEKILKENKSGKNAKAEQAMKKHGLDRIYLAEFSLKEDLTKVLERLNRDSRVEYAEPNYEVKADIIPNDLDFDKLWGLNNTEQTGGALDADIDAVDAWDTQTGSHDVVIAVIDTGVDYNHEDLASNIWTNSGEIPGNGKDDDSNGFVDDVHGYDFVNSDGDPMDDHYHGTHCAGTIGAVGDNMIGVAGVNWNVSIMPVKFLNASGSGTTTAAIASIDYATQMGVDVMSNSWGGGGFSTSLESAISAANDAGILFVAAAGNTSSNNDLYPHYPSSYDVPNVVSVAATDHNDNRASFSCYGAESVDLGAPGASIYSTKPNNTYGSLSGTSMATPHVAGAAGLIKAQYPSLASDGIKGRLFGGVDLISSMDGIIVTGGRLNVLNSLEEDTSPPATVSNLAVTGATHNSVSLTWIAVGDDDDEGTASSYDVRYSISPITSETEWDSATQAQGEPSPQPYDSKENFTVENLGFDTEYHFALKVIDNVGNQSGLSNYVTEATVPDNEPPSAVMDLNFLEATYSSITLKWTATGDDLDAGTASEYDVRYSTSTILTPGDWDSATQAQGEPSPQVSGSIENFTVGNLEFETTYYFALKVIDKVGNYSVISNDASGTTEAITMAFYDNMESGVNGWSSDGLWHYETYRSNSPVSSWAYNTGSPDYTFDTGARNYGSLTSPTINLSTFNSATLAFRYFYRTETTSTSYDRRWIQIGEDGIFTNYVQLSGDPMSVWNEYAVDLSSYAGSSNIQIRFFFDTIDSIYNNYEGWYIDDVAVFGDGSGENLPPVADAGGNQTVSDADNTGGENITLDGSGSYDPDGNIDSYEWYEISGVTPVSLGSGEVLNPDFSVGNYTVMLVVMDDEGATTIDEVNITVTPNQPPMAYAGEDQTVYDSDGIAGEEVILYGYESHDPDGYELVYEWKEGDITLSYEPYFSHNYFAGVHTITLTVTDIGGATHSDVVIVTVIVNQLPIADAGEDQTVDNINGDEIEAVTLNGSGSLDPDGTVLSYAWFEDLGSGISPSPICTGVSPEYDFSVGTHTVILVVTDDNLATASDTVTIIVNQLPIADAGEDQTVDNINGDEIEAVTLNGSGSLDPDGTVLSYAWFEDLGSGISPSPICTGVSPEYDFSVGTHTVILVVTDDNLATASDTVTIIVNQLPVADAGEEQTMDDIDGDGVEIVTLNGSGSYDPEEGILTYEWKEGDIVLDNSVSFSHNFTVGIHEIVLTVMDDNEATDSSTVIVTVNPNQSPAANIVAEIIGETVNFDGSGSNDPDGNIVSYNWDFGDGTTESGISSDVTHIYSSYGDHIVTLTVMDNGGAINTAITTAIIEDTVTEIDTIYDSKKETLTIKARSSAGSEAVLTASSAGSFENVAMRYDSRKNVFKVTIRKITPDPGSVTVESSLGGLGVYPPPLEE